MDDLQPLRMEAVELVGDAKCLCFKTAVRLHGCAKIAHFLIQPR
jgi:hypothetical protein